MRRGLLLSLLGIGSLVLGTSALGHAAGMAGMAGMSGMHNPTPKLSSTSTTSAGAGSSTSHANHKISPRETVGSGTRISLTTEPRVARAGNAVDFALRVLGSRGQAVPLASVHEKKAHVIVVSNDLREFDHIHPTAGGNGTRTLQYTPARGGGHTVFVTVTPKGGTEQMQRFPLKVAGRNAAERLELDLEPKSIGPTRVALQTATLRAGRPETLSFQLTNLASGAPQKLGKYLGASGHAIFISGDRDEFLHAHAMEGEMKSMPGMQMTPSRALPPGQVEFHVTLPKPGLYKVWGQFQAEGRTLTAPFVVHAQ